MKTRFKYLLKKLIYQGLRYKIVSAKLEKSQKYSHIQLEELQNKKLRKIIKHCCKNVPYYKDLFDSLGLKPCDIKTKEDLVKLPFMDKYIVRENFDKLIAKNSLKAFTYETKTSGTTGTPGKIMWDWNSLIFEYATVGRFYSAVNPKLKNCKKITLRGNFIKNVDDKNPPFWQYNPFDNELILSSYHLNKQTAKLYIEKISEFKSKVLHAYPSTAFLLAKYVEELGERINLESVFTSSEELSEDKRAFIAKVFNCSVFDWYGQVERVAAIGQCEEGSYHIQEDYSIVELIENDDGIEIVGTHLNNYSMPLLRYKTSDLVEIGMEKCDCGCEFRTISKIVGKNSDYYHFVTKNGTKITSFGYIPMGVENIIETQFVQEDVDELIINVVACENFSQNDKQKLVDNAKSRIGSDITVIVNEVKEIPRGANGKYRAVVNKLCEVNGW